MTNENDINTALKEINQKMLLNKKRIDIDNIVESIVIFFNNYFINLTTIVAGNIKDIKNINEDDPYIEIINKLTESFFKLIENKLQETMLDRFGSIKDKIPKLSDDDCNVELNRISSVIVNEISDFYLENASYLVNELCKNDEYSKNVSDYITKIVYNRVINMLKDRMMYSIKVIDNNNEENNQIIENINEKTINKV